MKAAAYARYSTDGQTNNSIAYQLARINEHCTQNKITVVSYYADEAESGTNIEGRTEFLRMLEAAHRREFNAVIIYDITRGSRDVGDWFNFRKIMKQLSIEVISVEDKLGDILNPNDFLLELISVGIGQHSVLTTRQKSIDGVKIKAKEGAFLGGYAPLGYDIEDGKYIINSRDAETVRLIFAMYAQGDSYASILCRLGGIKGKRGKPLGKNSINFILKNERYIGIYTWNKRKIKQMRKWAGGALNPDCVKIEGHIPAIIDIDTWERVQRRMSDNKGKSKNKAKREYLLSGLIECDICGATFVGHTSTNKKGYEHKTYICGNKYRTRSCTIPNGNAIELEAFIAANLKEYLARVNVEEMVTIIVDKVNAASMNLSAEKKELDEITNKISNGVKAILGGIDFPELEQEVNILRVRKSELEDIIAHNSKSSSKLDKSKLMDYFRHSTKNIDSNIKEVVKQLITKIYAHADGSFTVNVGVHIAHCGGRI